MRTSERKVGASVPAASPRCCTVLGLVLAGLALASAPGCSGRLPFPEIELGWRPVEELNAGLPRAVRVFTGRNDDLPLRAWYVRLRPDPGLSVQVVASPDTDGKESVGEFAARLGALVAVNGGYYRMDIEPARHVGLLLVDGAIVESALGSLLRGETRYYTARAALGFTADGYPEVAWVVTRNDSLFTLERPPGNRENEPAPRPEPTAARRWHVDDALAAGPALMSHGRIDITVDEEVFFGSTIPRIHPRTAAGVTRSGDLILLVVDGRQAASRGVDLGELAAIMRDLGCHEALNLDGGGSSTLVVNGLLLNRPAGGTSQREVMSALVVLPAPAR